MGVALGVSAANAAAAKVTNCTDFLAPGPY